jgi:hypothetical protein
MPDQLRPDDIVVVWKLDQLARSLKDLLHILEKLEPAGAGFRSRTESIDTTTPAGRMLMMMMQMVGSFAEFERAASAPAPDGRVAGRIGGRRAKLTVAQRADVVENWSLPVKWRGSTRSVRRRSAGSFALGDRRRWTDPCPRAVVWWTSIG